ncbi:MAG: tRNA-dihydrouridine synthase family protein [Opitutaceae bacterium]|nr:tRNA-dihydrouridine synthase family protein [Opitutaceae bacterium]
MSTTHPALARLPALIAPGQPPTALAPMQDVTDLPFMTAIGECGAPDWFFTEYFRVTETSRLEKHILRSITENPTGRPVFAQLIGENLPALRRAATELLKHPVAAIDLNMGCPAPKVYKKNVGGGLLRDLPKVDAILGTLRDAVTTRPFTVKTRIGFEDTRSFESLLDLINKHQVDLLSLHGRTVKELYRSEVHYDYIARAAERVACPVLANGNITSAEKAAAVVTETRCAGVMIGRSAIRNPWIFRQVRERFAGQPVTRVYLREVRAYVDRLWTVTDTPGIPERARVGKMKKYLNFVGQAMDAGGAFLAAMRPTATAAELFAVCDQHMLAEPDALFADEPFAGVIARPNCETPHPGPDADEACSLDTITA